MVQKWRNMQIRLSTQKPFVFASGKIKPKHGAQPVPYPSLSGPRWISRRDYMEFAWRPRLQTHPYWLEKFCFTRLGALWRCTSFTQLTTRPSFKHDWLPNLAPHQSHNRYMDVFPPFLIGIDFQRNQSSRKIHHPPRAPHSAGSHSKMCVSGYIFPVAWIFISHYRRCIAMRGEESERNATAINPKHHFSEFMIAAAVAVNQRLAQMYATSSGLEHRITALHAANEHHLIGGRGLSASIGHERECVTWICLEPPTKIKQNKTRAVVKRKKSVSRMQIGRAFWGPYLSAAAINKSNPIAKWRCTLVYRVGGSMPLALAARDGDA
jgi:hypothetical protein